MQALLQTHIDPRRLQVRILMSELRKLFTTHTKRPV
jgi:hypothetical protein